MPMNRALIGKEWSTLPAVEVTAEGARRYAEATNAHIAAYEGASPVAPPMFGVAYSVAALSAPLLDPALQVDMVRLVHGDQDMLFHAPVRPGDRIRSVSRVVDIVDKSSGELLVVGITCTNQRGETVMTSKSGLFVRGGRNKEALAFEKQEREDEENAWNAAAPVFERSETVAADQSRRYAAASGDTNPIHLDDEMARAANLPAIILHGLCTMAFVHNAVTAEVGNDPSRVKRLAVRFARPVLMGEVLSIQGRGPTAGPWILRVLNPAGQVVLKNGLAEVA